MGKNFFHGHKGVLGAGIFTLALLLCALPALAADLTPATEKLFEAVTKNDMAGVRDSVAKGADLSARNVRELTPIDLAVNNGFFDIVQYLLAERNRRIKERLGTADSQAPDAPPTRLDPPRAAAELPEQPPGPAKPMEPGVAPAQTAAAAKTAPKAAPVPASLQPAPRAQEPDPAYEDKPSAFIRLGERFLSRFDFITDLFRSKKKAPEPAAPASPQPEKTPPQIAGAPAIPEKPANIAKPATVPAEAAKQPAPTPPSPTATATTTTTTVPSLPSLEEAEAMVMEESPPAAQTPAPPTTYMAKPAAPGIEPPKPQAAPAPAVLAETITPAPKPKALPEAKPEPDPAQPAVQAPVQSEAEPTPPPAPAPTPTEAPSAPPAAPSDPSAFQKFADRFADRFRELFGIEKSKTVATEKPNSFVAAIKQTMARIRNALLPGEKQTQTAAATPQGPIILARPGETPPPPPGQLVKDDVSKFADVPEGAEPAKQAATAPVKPAPQPKPLSPIEDIEKDLAALIDSQAIKEKPLSEKKAPAKPARKQDKILAGKEIDAVLSQLAGAIPNLPPESKTPVVVETKQPAQRTGPLTQQQAESDVLDLLMNEADKISGKRPAAKTAQKTPAQSPPLHRTKSTPPCHNWSITWKSRRWKKAARNRPPRRS